MIVGMLILIIAIVVALVILIGLISLGIASGFFILMFADVVVFGAIVYLICRHHKNKKNKK